MNRGRSDYAAFCPFGRIFTAVRLVGSLGDFSEVILPLPHCCMESRLPASRVR